MASFRLVYSAISIMLITIIYLNSFANEGNSKSGRDSRPYVILSTSNNLEVYDRLCLNGPAVDCYGDTICKIAKIECPAHIPCDLFLPICADKEVEDYQPRKFNITSTR